MARLLLLHSTQGTQGLSLARRPHRQPLRSGTRVWQLRTPPWSELQPKMLEQSSRVKWEDKIELAMHTGNVGSPFRKKLATAAVASPDTILVNEVCPPPCRLMWPPGRIMTPLPLPALYRRPRSNHTDVQGTRVAHKGWAPKAPVLHGKPLPIKPMCVPDLSLVSVLADIRGPVLLQVSPQLCLHWVR